MDKKDSDRKNLVSIPGIGKNIYINKHDPNYWEKLLQYDRNNARAHYEIGRKKEREGLYEDALHYYEKAKNLDPALLAAAGASYTLNKKLSNLECDRGSTSPEKKKSKGLLLLLLGACTLGVVSTVIIYSHFIEKESLQVGNLVQTKDNRLGATETSISSGQSPNTERPLLSSPNSSSVKGSELTNWQGEEANEQQIEDVKDLIMSSIVPACGCSVKEYSKKFIPAAILKSKQPTQNGYPNAGLPNAISLPSSPGSVQNKTVIINPGDIYVYVSRDDKILVAGKWPNQILGAYPVAIGKPSTPTPAGGFTIVNKQRNPGGGYGSAWLGFDLESYGIHGTNDPDSIGKDKSEGCVRMNNKDMVDLYDKISVGTKVIIT